MVWILKLIKHWLLVSCGSSYVCYDFISYLFLLSFCKHLFIYFQTCLHKSEFATSNTHPQKIVQQHFFIWKSPSDFQSYWIFPHRKSSILILPLAQIILLWILFCIFSILQFNKDYQLFICALLIQILEVLLYQNN